MKTLHALLIILLVSLYKANEKCNSTVKPSQASDCNNREKNTDSDYRCCYIYQKYTIMGSIVEGKSCSGVTKTEFDNIKDVIKSLKDGIEKMGGKFDTFDIDCSSGYLYISLLSFVLFLL